MNIIIFEILCVFLVILFGIVYLMISEYIYRKRCKINAKEWAEYSKDMTREEKLDIFEEWLYINKSKHNWKYLHIPDNHPLNERTRDSYQEMINKVREISEIMEFDILYVDLLSCTAEDDFVVFHFKVEVFRFKASDDKIDILLTKEFLENNSTDECVFELRWRLRENLLLLTNQHYSSKSKGDSE